MEFVYTLYHVTKVQIYVIYVRKTEAVVSFNSASFHGEL